MTLMSSAFAPELTSRRLAVLDPLCGRGTTLDSGPYLQFRHRVDQAIVRDVLVARKPAAAAG